MRPHAAPLPELEPTQEERPLAAAGLATAAAGGALGALAAVSPPAGVGAALVLGLLLMLRRWHDAVPVLAVALIYSNAVVILAQSGTVPTSAAALLLGALAFSVVRDVVQTRALPPGLPGLPLVLIFAAMQCFSCLFSVAPTVAQAEVYGSLTEGIAVFVLVGYAVVGGRTLMSIVNALLLIGAVLGALSLIQSLTGDYTNTFFGFAGVSNADVGAPGASAAEVQMRLNGNVGETNRYAQVLAVLLPLAAVRFATTRSILVKVLTVVAAALITGGIVFTFSRGAAAALVGVLVTLVVMRWVKLRWLVGGLLVGLLVALSTPAYAERLASFTTILGATEQAGSSEAADNAVRGRATEVISAVLVFADRPVLGVGPGVFPVVSPKYAQEVGIRPRLEERQAHNLYAGIAAETGLLGLVPFLLLFWRLLSGLSRAAAQWWSLDRTQALLARGFFAAVLVYAYSGMFLHLSYVRYFWVLVGLAAAAARLPDSVRRPLPAWWARRWAKPPAPVAGAPIDA